MRLQWRWPLARPLELYEQGSAARNEKLVVWKGSTHAWPE